MLARKPSINAVRRAVCFYYQIIPELKESEDLLKLELGAAEGNQIELKPFNAAWFHEHMQSSFMDKAIYAANQMDLESVAQRDVALGEVAK